MLRSELIYLRLGLGHSTVFIEVYRNRSCF